MIRLVSDPGAPAKEMMRRMKEVAIRTLQIAGEKATNEARQQTESEGRNYTDRTGNLRNSTGYVIVENGRVLFRALKGTTPKGREMADKTLSGAISEVGNNLTLIVCAGMEYASYVAARGYNVLDSAEIVAQRVIDQMNL